mmetsp:Transcript_28211/g.39242  ORF Transcript_28211/g.39242 Transcript_28211/m.39242 type:complete len:269 (-) Transcript_28211:12-818(-)
MSLPSPRFNNLGSKSKLLALSAAVGGLATFAWMTYKSVRVMFKTDGRKNGDWKEQKETERLQAIVEKYKAMLGEEKRNEAKLAQEVERLRNKIQEATNAYDRIRKKPRGSDGTVQKGEHDLESNEADAMTTSCEAGAAPGDENDKDNTKSSSRMPSTPDTSRRSSSASATWEPTSSSPNGPCVRRSRRSQHSRMSSLATLRSADSEDFNSDSLPDIWIGYLDEKTGCMYYYNPGLNKTSWAEPDRKTNNILIHVDAVQQIKEASTEEV